MLESSVQFIKGVGAKRASLLQKLGINTVQDLVCHYPRGYIDFTDPKTAVSAEVFSVAALRLTVFSKTPPVKLKGGKTLQKVFAGDDTGSVQLVFFNNPYAAKALQEGAEYFFYGKINGTNQNKEMLAPIIVPVTQKVALVPIYSLTAGISSKYLGLIIKNALDTVKIPEILPNRIVEKYGFFSKQEAIHSIHFPSSLAQAEQAKNRLIFEELLLLQLGLILLGGRSKKTAGNHFSPVDLKPFFSELPFTPTPAQYKVIDEIVGDYTKATPQNRLLQGDVGSGKTVVAAAAVYIAAKNNGQSAVMVPTEILALQHYETFNKLLSPLGIKTALLTASVKGAKRNQLITQLEDGETQLVVGTHAILSEPIQFKNLALAVTDEQHRFGVRQRGTLAKKSQEPHILVMSATPIPRTLALLIYGDLDISVLDELPKGRKPIKTYCISSDKKERMYRFMKELIAHKKQCYVVCPLVEESDTDLIDVVSYGAKLKDIFSSAKIGVMHGKLPAKEKNLLMEQFCGGEIDILVSTTVIEVGVDVPNAVFIAIENAERFGLSALHQLRGRVGRGEEESFCILITDSKSETAKQRLDFLCKNIDGFKIAKYDLEMRGPGDFFGNKQHGLPPLTIASLAADSEMLKAAANEVQSIYSDDKELIKPQNTAIKKAIEQLFGRKNGELN